MSRVSLVIVGAVLVVLVAVMGYFGLQRDTGITVIILAVVCLAALGAAIAVSRKS
jgi:membrane-bound ClpP family serine protease